MTENPHSVLHIIPAVGQGGAERLLSELVRRAPAHVRHHVLSLTNDQTPFDWGMAEIQTLGLKRGELSVRAAWQLMGKVRKSRPDIVHGWLYHGNIAAALARLLGPRVFWSIHNTGHSRTHTKTLTRGVDWLSSRLSSHVPERIIYCSQKARDMHESEGYDRRRGVIIENGVDLGAFSVNPPRRDGARHRLGLDPADLAIGAFGRFSPQKGHETLFSALLQLPAALPWRLILAGQDCDLRHPGLAALIERHGLGTRVLCLGEQTNMPELYAALDLFCLASDFGEASPLSLIEAAAAGIPVVTTDVGDVDHLVLSPEHIVPRGASTAMAAAIMGALDRQRSPDAALLAQARLERVEARHRIEAFVEAMHALYAAPAHLPQERGTD
ncbi:glycosyltransferase [Phreatobacter sp. HK31-P]